MREARVNETRSPADTVTLYISTSVLVVSPSLTVPFPAFLASLKVSSGSSEGVGTEEDVIPETLRV